MVCPFPGSQEKVAGLRKYEFQWVSFPADWRRYVELPSAFCWVTGRLWARKTRSKYLQRFCFGRLGSSRSNSIERVKRTRTDNALTGCSVQTEAKDHVLHQSDGESWCKFNAGRRLGRSKRVTAMFLLRKVCRPRLSPLNMLRHIPCILTTRSAYYGHSRSQKR